MELTADSVEYATAAASLPGGPGGSSPAAQTVTTAQENAR